MDINWEVLKCRTTFECVAAHLTVGIKVLLALGHSNIIFTRRCFRPGCGTHKLAGELLSLIPVPSSTCSCWNAVNKLTSECGDWLVCFLLDKESPARWNTSSPLSQVSVYFVYYSFWRIIAKSNCCCFSSISLSVILGCGWILQFHVYVFSLQYWLLCSDVRNKL